MKTPLQYCGSRLVEDDRCQICLMMPMPLLTKMLTETKIARGCRWLNCLSMLPWS